MSDSKAIFKFRRWLGRLMAGIVLLLILLFLMAQTPWGKQAVAHGLGRVLSRQLRLELHIEGLKGFIPFHTSVERIGVRAQGREVADMEDVRWRWAVRPLTRGVLHLDYITARSVSISATQLEREKKGEREPRRLASLTRLILDRVEVESLEFKDPVVPGGAVFSVSGEFAPDHEHERVLALRARLKTWGERTFEDEDRPVGMEADLMLDFSGGAFPVHVQLESRLQGADTVWRSGHLLSGPEVSGSARAIYEADGTLSVESLSVDAEGITADGTGFLDPRRPHLEAELTVDCPDASVWEPLFGWGFSGRTELNLELRSENGRRDFLLEGGIREVRYPQGELDRVDISVHLQDVRQDLRADARLEFRKMRAGEALLSNAVAKVWGDRATLEYMIDADGWFNEEIELSCNGQVNMNGALESVRFERFEARYGEYPISLLRPTTFQVAEDGYTVEHMVLQMGPGYLLGSGLLTPEDMDLNLRVTRFPLRTLGFAGVLDEAASVEGALRFTGSPGNPTGALSILFSGIRPRHVEYWDAPPATLNVEARLEDRDFSVAMALAELSEEPVRFDLSFPLELSFLPPALTWPPEGNLEGLFSVEADLENMARLFLLDLHFVYGKLSARYDISGTVKRPEFTGRLEVRDGVYENDRTGTVLRDIEVLLRADNHHLRLERVTATDGRRGRLELKGQMTMSPAEQFPFMLEGTLSDLRVMRQDFVEVTASGSLTCEGTLYESLLGGDLVLGPVEVTVPERVPPGLVELEVIEIFEEEEPEPPPPPRPRAHTMRFDVTVRLPDRGFVRGRGLDSEWSGQVEITGRADEPDIRGELSVIRGRFNFFGKRLRLTHGTVTFDGTFPPSPYLDVTAEARVRGITGILHLSGDAMAPEIRLDSMPPMPEDEILAWLLFGRDISRITPWQALVMAQAVNSLRREGTTYDFMGRTRRILGVDQFEIRPAEEEEGVTTVSVGKYIRDDVFVELEHGTEAETGRARVEIELLPTVTLETIVGTDAEGGLGLNWRWDY